MYRRRMNRGLSSTSSTTNTPYLPLFPIAGNVKGDQLNRSHTTDLPAKHSPKLSQTRLGLSQNRLGLSQNRLRLSQNPSALSQNRSSLESARSTSSKDKQNKTDKKTTGVDAGQSIFNVTDSELNEIEGIFDNSDENNHSETVDSAETTTTVMGRSYFDKFFYKVLKECGVFLQSGAAPHYINEEPNVVAKKIHDELNKGDVKANVRNFILDFEDYCSTEAVMEKLMKSTKVQFEMDDSLIQKESESVLKILLGVECLESRIVEFSLNKIVDCALDESPAKNCTLRSRLRCLRFVAPRLDCGVEPYIKYLDAIEAAPEPSQRELLTFLPEIFPITMHETAAKSLSQMLRYNTPIVPQIIECLECFKNTEEVQEYVMETIQSPIPLNYIPILTRYLLTTCKEDEFTTLVCVLRNSIYFGEPATLDSSKTVVSSSKKDNERSSCQILTLEHLQWKLMKNKLFVQVWLKLILSKKPVEQRPIDIAILIILYSCGENEKKTALNAFKKLVTSGNFTCTLFDEAINKFLVIEAVQLYLTEIIEIATSLLHLRAQPLVLDFASNMFIKTFLRDNIQIYEKQDIVIGLANLSNSDNVSVNTAAYKILGLLTEEHTEKIIDHGLILLGLLDRFDSLCLSEMRKVMKILCKIGFGVTNDSVEVNAVKTDLEMIISKQLSSDRQDVKLKGIIAAVSAIRYIISLPSSEDEVARPHLNESTNTTLSVNDLPCSRARAAATLVELIRIHTKQHPEAMTLAHDEMSAMLFGSTDTNPHFITYISDVLTAQLLDTYVTSQIPSSVDGIKLTAQFCINAKDEQEEFIAVNIGKFCFEQKTSPTNKTILLLTPLFRLLRQAEYLANNGVLKSIDALLGCAIIMPEVDVDVGLSSFTLENSMIILNCYFHCINWFREIINAFLGTNSSLLHGRVILRVKELVRLERIFIKFLKSLGVPYRPPISYFEDDVKQVKENVLRFAVAKKPTAGKRKRGKKNAEVPCTSADANRTGISQTITQMNTQVNISTVLDQNRIQINGDDERLVRKFFRELDPDILQLLKDPIDITSNENDATTKLSCNELRYILEDLIAKHQAIASNQTVTSSFGRPKTSTSHNIENWDAKKFINDCVLLAPYIKSHLGTIANYLKNLLEESDNIRDAPSLFNSSLSNVKICFGLLLEFLHCTFAWYGFKNLGNLELLRGGLQALVDTERNMVRSVRELVKDLCNKLEGYVDQCLYLSSAVSLVKLLETLLTFTGDDNTHAKLVDVSGNLLAMSWCDLKGSPDVGAQYNSNINSLIKAYLSRVNLNKLQEIIAWVQDEIGDLKNKISTLKTFPSIQRANFPLLYRSLCQSLSQLAQEKFNEKITTNQHLIAWRKVGLALQGLLNVSKAQSLRTNLVSYFKYSLIILKTFLSKGMPILEIELKKETEAVVDILKIFQQSTRFLNALCCHSKLTKDGGLVNLVPSMRCTLETLVYRVQAALAANNCSSAFWMGNLKNKNLQGEEIGIEETSELPDEIDDQVPSEEEMTMDESEIGNVNDSDEEEPPVPARKRKRKNTIEIEETTNLPEEIDEQVPSDEEITMDESEEENVNDSDEEPPVQVRKKNRKSSIIF